LQERLDQQKKERATKGQEYNKDFKPQRSKVRWKPAMEHHTRTNKEQCCGIVHLFWPVYSLAFTCCALLLAVLLNVHLL
jgi:hypothetical protein